MTRCAVVIPLYKCNHSDEELVSLHRITTILDSTNLIILTHLEQGESVFELFPLNTKIITFDSKYFKSTRTYSRLLMSLEFYNHFTEYTHILICQTDVFVCEDHLQRWLTEPYDFIGAPNFEGYDTSASTVFKQTLNGGFSLRNVSACIRVLKEIKLQYSPLKLLWQMEKEWTYRLIRIFRDGLVFNYYNIPFLAPIINEDLFWSYIVPKRFPWFKVPTPEVASRFAYDYNPRYLYNYNNEELPMAIHAWWKYDREFVEELIEKHNL